MTEAQKNKHPILDLLSETKIEQDWQLVTLLGAVSREGSYGQFIKLTFRNDEDFDGERTATCDRVHFDSLLPFIERFKAAEANKDGGGEVLIPVYLAQKSNKWKFSPTGAAVLLQDSLYAIPEMVNLENESHYQKYEFRYRSNTSIKRKFQEIAESRGLSLNNFLKFIILREIESAGL